MTIPDSVTSIGDHTFYNCGSLTSVTIGDNVTSIGSGAFSSCNSALYTEYNYGKYVGDSENPYSVLIELTNKNFTTYDINEKTKTIACGVFSGCGKLYSIMIPDSVTSIGSFAFSGCASLTSVTIGNSVTSIGDYAFEFCDSLTSITIPDSVTSIGSFAFYGCTSLTSITIPDSVISIGSWAFYGCTKLTSVYYMGTETEWSRITIDSNGNSAITNATRYYYSQTKPTDAGNYWHYIDGVSTPWENN